VMIYRNGKPRTVKLGAYPELTVKGAREKARAYFENPERFNAQAQFGSFKDVAENWFERHVKEKELRSQAEIRRQLEKYVYPRWKDRKFLEIRRREVNDLLDQIADRHGRAQADAVLATIRQIMGWHQSRDEDYTNPIVKGMRRNQSTARDRIKPSSWALCQRAVEQNRALAVAGNLFMKVVGDSTVINIKAERNHGHRPDRQCRTVVGRCRLS
jgi:hypothetical protein